MMIRPKKKPNPDAKDCSARHRQKSEGKNEPEGLLTQIQKSASLRQDYLAYVVCDGWLHSCLWIGRWGVLYMVTLRCRPVFHTTYVWGCKTGVQKRSAVIGERGAETSKKMVSNVMRSMIVNKVMNKVSSLFAQSKSWWWWSGVPRPWMGQHL